MMIWLLSTIFLFIVTAVVIIVLTEPKLHQQYSVKIDPNILEKLFSYEDNQRNQLVTATYSKKPEKSHLLKNIVIIYQEQPWHTEMFPSIIHTLNQMENISDIYLFVPDFKDSWVFVLEGGEEAHHRKLSRYNIDKFDEVMKSIPDPVTTVRSIILTTFTEDSKNFLQKISMASSAKIIGIAHDQSQKKIYQTKFLPHLKNRFHLLTLAPCLHQPCFYTVGPILASKKEQIQWTAPDPKFLIIGSNKSVKETHELLSCTKPDQVIWVTKIIDKSAEIFQKARPEQFYQKISLQKLIELSTSCQFGLLLNSSKKPSTSYSGSLSFYTMMNMPIVTDEKFARNFELEHEDSFIKYSSLTNTLKTIMKDFNEKKFKQLQKSQHEWISKQTKKTENLLNHYLLY